MSSEAVPSIERGAGVGYDGQAEPLAADRMKTFLTVHQLAQKLQVSADWIYDQASSGGMPSYRIGTIRRFRMPEIEDWLERHREPADVGRPHALRAS